MSFRRGTWSAIWTASVADWTASVADWTASVADWTASVADWTASVADWTASVADWTASVADWTSSVADWTASIGHWTSSSASTWHVARAPSPVTSGGLSVSCRSDGYGHGERGGYDDGALKPRRRSSSAWPNQTSAARTSITIPSTSCVGFETSTVPLPTSASTTRPL